MTAATRNAVGPRPVATDATAVCAPTVYRGDRLPAEVYGNVFVAEPAGNVVSRIVLNDDGATLRASQIRRANPELAAAINAELKGQS